MDSRTPDRAPASDAADFVRFCYRRRPVGWPELYDEMCAVANRRLFRGWGQEELGSAGVTFTLFELPALASLVAHVVAEEQARRAGRQLATAPAPAAPAEPVAEPVTDHERTPEPARDGVAALSFAAASAG
jgi:hypothetical protein